MRILQILLLLLLCLSNVYSGTPQNNVEKMKSRLNSSGRTLEKIWMLNWLSFEFNKLESRTSQDSSLKYGREALELSKENRFPEGEAEALSNLGYAYFLQNNTSSAKEYLLKALTIAEKIQHRKVMSAINDNLGLVYWKKNDYFLALKHYDEALKDAISSNNEFEHARVLNNLGLIYLKLGKHKQALDNFLESARIKESLGDQFWLAITYNNLANLYNEMKSYRESLKYSETALEIGKQINISYITARALNNLGSSYDGLLLFDKSLKYFKEALLLKAKMGDTKNLNYVYTLLEIGKRYYNTKNYALSLDYFNRTIILSKDLHNADITSNAFMNLGRSYIKLGDLDLAQSNLDKAMGISKNFKLGKVTRDCYLAYHDLYLNRGDYKQALESYKLYSTFKDSINTSEVMQRIAGLEQAYKFEKTVDTLKLQQREKELALERQTYINHFLIAGSALAIVFIFILFSRYKLVKTNKEITEGKNKEIEKQKFQLEQLNATKDKFFSIIAHDLKNPFNILFGLSDMLLEDFNQLSEDEKLMLINQIKNVSRNSFNLLENLLQWSMSQSNSLKINLQRFNLSELVTEAKLSVCENAKAKDINLFSDGPHDLMANDDYNIVLTVLRNLLMNAIKFTHHGGEIKIISQIKNDKITICVQDNGIGMSNEVLENLFRLGVNHTTSGTNNEKGTGLGLVLCKEFLDKTGNSIWVESQQGKGSRFYFTANLFMPN